MKFPSISKHALIIFLLWAFAPLAWFLLWQDKKYHSWFPKLLWVNGIIFTIIFVTQSFVFVPKLLELYKALNIQIPPETTPFGVFLVLVFVILQIPAGFYLQEKIRVHKSLTDRYVYPILLIFLIDGIFALSTGFLSAVQSPTALVEKFFKAQQNQTITVTNSNHLPTPIFVGRTPAPSPTPTPTPRPLTFSEMNSLYGPCVHLPTLMYHHIETIESARPKGQTGLAVEPATFRAQMEYLVAKGYRTIAMQDLVNFFDTGAQIPAKSVLLTFDDGYEDFYFNAFPILSSMGLRATMFLPTGLVGNPDYMNWGEISQANASGLVLFANHTWSHHPMNKIASNTLDQEINVPDSTLAARGFGNPRVFAYPYGTVGEQAQGRLKQLGYEVAFTTKPGNVLCKKQGLTLPRVRIGNSSLANYGF